VCGALCVVCVCVCVLEVRVVRDRPSIFLLQFQCTVARRKASIVVAWNTILFDKMKHRPKRRIG
jgi:hypothetical protein